MLSMVVEGLQLVFFLIIELFLLQDVGLFEKHNKWTKFSTKLRSFFGGEANAQG